MAQITLNSTGVASNGTLALQTNGTTPALTIDASQNVGIGTASPTSLFFVNGESSLGNVVFKQNVAAYTTGYGNPVIARASGFTGVYNSGSLLLQARSDAAADIAFITGTTPAERMRIDSSGNVGIGTSSPAVSGLEISRATGSASPTPAELRISTTNSASDWSTTNPWGRLSFYSADASSTGPKIVSSIDATAEGTSGGTGNISFKLAAATTGTLTEAMRITSTGDVGIGATSPGGKLEVAGNSRFLGNGSASVFWGNTTPIGSLTYVGSDPIVQALSSANMLFYGGSTERMRIDSSGNLQVQTGAVMPYAPAPASISSAATLTNANIQAQIINTTGTTYTVTMPLGTTLETLASWATTGIGYDFYIVNTASGTITLDATEVGVTSVGTMTIATGVSAQFRIRRTAANTFVVYRLG